MIKLGLKFHGNKRGQDYEITDPDPNLIKRMKENNITFQQIDSGKYKLIIFDVDSIFTEADVISSLERHLTVTKELRNFNVRRKNGRNFIIGFLYIYCGRSHVVTIKAGSPADLGHHPVKYRDCCRGASGFLWLYSCHIAELPLCRA